MARLINGDWLLRTLESHASQRLAAGNKRKEADALLEAQTKRMSNLTTVLALLFPTEFTLLTFLPPLLPSSAIQDLDVEASNWAAAAVIAASIAIGATMVGLVGAVFFQMLAGQVRKGHATDFLTLSKPVAWLSFFAVIGVGVSCLSITISLACSVWVRYDNHSSPSAVVDANHSSAVVAANHLSALTVVAANHSSVVVAANHSSAVVAANHVVACILIVAVFSPASQRRACTLRSSPTARKICT